MLFFLAISVIFSIHLIHLGSRENNKIINSNLQITSHKLYRADIVDRNRKYLVKTVNFDNSFTSNTSILNMQRPMTG